MRLTVILIIFIVSISVFAQQPQRMIAITIDDLPVVSTRTDLKNRQKITRKIIGHITKANVPVIGFVNENKLYAGDKRDEKQIDLLRMWLDADLELGNHTFSHNSLNTHPLDEYEADLLQGEAITKELLAAKGKPIRFFRHPYLQTGRTMKVKADLDIFLKEHGYTIAPITIDNADYIFSRGYDMAFDKGDKKQMKKIGDAYVPYMESKLAYWERQSVKLFGREVAQTLLIHANFINSDYLGAMIAMFKGRGYKCVDLETALKDEAYRRPDTFVGAGGISWLHRWALEGGKQNLEPNEPMVPDFILKYTGLTE